MDAKKILLIEDEKNIILGVKTCPEVANYRVVVVENGEKALEVTFRKTRSYPADLMLPGIDGFEVCQKLKSMDDTKEIPVVVLTAKRKKRIRKSKGGGQCIYD